MTAPGHDSPRLADAKGRDESSVRSLTAPGQQITSRYPYLAPPWAVASIQEELRAVPNGIGWYCRIQADPAPVKMASRESSNAEGGAKISTQRVPPGDRLRVNGEARSSRTFDVFRPGRPKRCGTLVPGVVLFRVIPERLFRSLFRSGTDGTPRVTSRDPGRYLYRIAGRMDLQHVVLIPDGIAPSGWSPNRTASTRW